MRDSGTCPHCSKAVWFEEEPEEIAIPVGEYSPPGQNFFVVTGSICPSCGEIIVFCRYEFRYDKVNPLAMDIRGELEIIYPKDSTCEIPEHLPKNIAEDYQEASIVLPYSPKASAALGRRILQSVIRTKYKITKSNLYQEVEALKALHEIPTHLKEDIDDIRQYGNFSAHEKEDKHTGEIIDVEPGEAKDLLGILDTLLGIAYTQPERARLKREARKKKIDSAAKVGTAKQNAEKAKAVITE